MKHVYYKAFGNKNLSTVVLTQKALCDIIPIITTTNRTSKNDCLKTRLAIYAPNIVIKVSDNAKSINGILVLCDSSLGFPNISLY